jgi:transposase
MAAKIRVANRTQVEMRAESLDQLLPPEHPVRGVWEFVTRLDLSPWAARIVSRQGAVGASALDPRVLAALWLWATLQGVGSAREIARLCAEHLAYRWLCGDEPVNHHSLSDFRASDPAWLEGLLVQSAAALVHAGVADLTRVAQDGVRVRASAGAGSFRREATLERCREEARQQVEALREQRDDPAAARGTAARERVARERVERLDRAWADLKELQAADAQQPPSRRKGAEALRVSTTDPEARRMKMADGGFRPAYNVQLATTVRGGVVVGVDVVNAGVDAHQMGPMRERIAAQYQKRPGQYLVDGGFVTDAAIAAAERDGTAVLAPVRDAAGWLAKGKDPYAPRPDDPPELARWRARMGTPEAQAGYHDRAATAEWANAQARNRGLQQFRVRGLAKVRSVSLWYGLAHNFTRGTDWGRLIPD